MQDWLPGMTDLLLSFGVRNGHLNYQKVMKQVTTYKIHHMHATTEAMTTTHS